MREPCLSRPDAGPPVLLILAGLIAAILVSVFDGAFLQPDSAQYLSIARNLMAGQGAATSLVWTEEHHRLGSLPVVIANTGFAIPPFSQTKPALSKTERSVRATHLDPARVVR